MPIFIGLIAINHPVDVLIKHVIESTYNKPRMSKLGRNTVGVSEPKRLV